MLQYKDLFKFFLQKQKSDITEKAKNKSIIFMLI